MVTAGKSDSSVQLVGSTPQQAGRSTTVEEMADARPAACVGTAHQCGRPPKSQCTVVMGGSPPSSLDRGVPDSDGYSTASEAIGTIARATEGVGRRSSWLLQDWIC